MDLAAPELLWLMLAALPVAGLAALAWRRRLRSIAAFSSRGLWDRLLPGLDRRRLAASVALLALAVVCLAAALARPRWGLAEQQIERRGVDVVFVLDTSLSMATDDVQPNRLWVAQTLVRRIVQDLPGHRVGLVQAEGDGVAMVPLTADAAVVDLMLDTVMPGSLPTPGTDLAASIERALELLPADGDRHPVLVVVSDGEDHGRNIEAVLEKLDGRHVVVHALGVGTPQGKPLELPFATGPTPEYKRDRDGQVVVSRLEEENLERLARATGGVYRRATSAGIEITPLIDPIRRMESGLAEAESIEVLEERFQWPLGAATVLLVLHLALAPFRRGDDGGPA
ncbi:MAG: VWA domain-containing protein [Acidobacteriota bacterium]